MNLQYRVWDEGGLWYWEILNVRGARLRYGAADRCVAARAEAMWCATDAPARLADEVALEASEFKAHREEARMALFQAHEALGAALRAAQGCEWLLARSDRLLSRARGAISAQASVSRMTNKERRQHAARCRELAEAALTERQRECFFNIARLYEREAELLDRAVIGIAHSRELLAKTERQIAGAHPGISSVI